MVKEGDTLGTITRHLAFHVTCLQLFMLLASMGDTKVARWDIL